MFRLGGEDYYVQDGDDFGVDFDSIIYRGSDVIKSAEEIEPRELPKAHDYIKEEDFQV